MPIWQTNPVGNIRCCATNLTYDAARTAWDFQDCIEGSAIADLAHRRTGRAGGLGDARPAAAIAHLGIEAIAFLLEACHDRSLERAAARQFDAHRVDEPAVDQNFVVDVGAGRLPGRTDEADHLALPHPLADFHALGKGRHAAV